jgi:phosphoglycolate phosphatase-like HAD superfamily hydrolase
MGASSTLPIRGALLDVDGTLLDSNDAHAQSWVDALAKHGINRHFEELRRLIGMGSDQLLPAIGIDASSERAQAMKATRSKIFLHEYLPKLQPFPSARVLLQHMRKLGLKLVVASSASGDELDGLLERAGVADVIESRTSADDAESSKPAPDIVEAARAVSGFAADEVLLVGDTPYDVAAGMGAGVGVVAVRCGGWTDPDLKGALAIYDDPADLLRWFESSPFARR